MTIDELEEALEDLEDEDPPIMRLEPRHFFDDFIIGIGERGPQHFLLYDKDAMITAMAAVGAAEDDDEEDPETSALEHFDFNMNQGGDGLPVYVSLLDRHAD